MTDDKMPPLPDPAQHVQFSEPDCLGIRWPSRPAMWAADQMLAHRKEYAAARAAPLVEALEALQSWARAYPLSVFPEPDLARAHELLQAGGMTLDAISASNMRHVITQTSAIVDAALASFKESQP